MNVGLLLLALKCARGLWDYDREKFIPEVNVVKKVETETDILHFWNSSNNSGFNERRALSYISELLEKGESSGSVSVDFSEIMFEVTEK